MNSHRRGLFGGESEPALERDGSTGERGRWARSQVRLGDSLRATRPRAGHRLPEY